MNILLPDDVRHILRILNDDGHAAYTVGGCVRDCLMGLTPKDWDIATSATPPRVKQLFKRTVDTGLQHGTITVLLNRAHYEVTTFRVDGVYLDGRHPSAVRFTDHIEDDVSRRDFTMNAIAYHPDKGFVDPFDGRGDITRRVIRCVGRPEHRFNEDALRMLRAVRFAAQLGFTIDPETIEAIPPLSERLALVSAERIREELTRLLTAAHPEAALFLRSTGLLPYVLRGHAYRGDLCEAVRRIKNCPKQTAMVYALFLSWAGNVETGDSGTHDNEARGDEAKVDKTRVDKVTDDGATILRELRFDKKTVQETVLYINMLPQPLPAPHDRYAIKQMLRRIPPVYFDRLLTLKAISNDIATFVTTAATIEALRAAAADILSSGECFTLDTLAVNGNDLAAAGIARGKAMGDVLAALLDAVMREPALNTREALLRILTV